MIFVLDAIKPFLSGTFWHPGREPLRNPYRRSLIKLRCDGPEFSVSCIVTSRNCLIHKGATNLSWGLMASNDPAGEPALYLICPAGRSTVPPAPPLPLSDLRLRRRLRLCALRRLSCPSPRAPCSGGDRGAAGRRAAECRRLRPRRAWQRRTGRDRTARRTRVRPRRAPSG